MAGSSMGARIVLEMARRGYPGAVVALDPDGFWDDVQVRIFGSRHAAQRGRPAGLFPDATLHWFDRCGHFPHWDQPGEASELILAATS